MGGALSAATDIRAWFDEYLEAFGACGRGADHDVRGLLRYLGVPLILTTDDAAAVLRTEDEVVDAMRAQIKAMRAAGYARSETRDVQPVAVNARTAILTADLSRRRADGDEIVRLRATYLIADGGSGRRIHSLAVHGAGA